MSRQLILIKHAQPAIVPSHAANRWELSLAGQTGAQLLAARLAPFQPAVLVASMEPKAQLTAQIVARELGLPQTSAPNLHEHERSTVGWHDTATFQALVQRLFQEPAQLVWGDETAEQATARFVTAVDHVLGHYPHGNVAIVAHGTVISLLLAARSGVDGWTIWQRLGLPSFVVVNLPSWELVCCVTDVTQPAANRLF